MSALLKFAHIEKGTPLKHILGHLGLTSLRTMDPKDAPHLSGIYRPRPSPGSLYEKYYGDTKIEGAGGNLTGGLTHNLPLWADTNEFGGNKLIEQDNRGAAPKRGGEYKGQWAYDLRNQKGWDNLYGADAMRTTLWPDMESTANIYDRMVAANPEQLGDVNLVSGLENQEDFWRRLKGNDRSKAPDELMTPEEADKWREDVLALNPELKDMLESGWEEPEQPSYSAHSNTVLMPKKDDAALIHELGHGIDWNSSIMGDEYIDPKSIRGTIKRWLRNTYTQNATYPNVQSPFTEDGNFRNPLHGPTRLWAETKAWDRGLDSYLEGSAMRGDKWEDIKDNVRKWAIERDPALHSYARHHMPEISGDAMGAAGGLAAYAGARKHLRPLIKNRPSTARFFPGGKPRIKRGLLGLAALAGGATAARAASGLEFPVSRTTTSGAPFTREESIRGMVGRGLANMFFSKMRDRSRINDEVEEIKQRYEGM